eukprot:scaffold1605_cov141-Cylindrotheca_fusiformis.AAC.5
MAKVRKKRSWGSSSISGSDSSNSRSGSSSKDSIRSDANASSSTESIEPSSVKSGRDNSFANSDRKDRRRERGASRPVEDVSSQSSREEAYRRPGQGPRNQRALPDEENQEMPDRSPRGINKRTATESSPESKERENEAENEDKPVEEKPNFLTRQRKIITCLTLFLTCLCLLVTLGVGIAIGLASAKDDNPSRAAAPAPTLAPTRSQPAPTGPVTQPPATDSPIETAGPTDATLLEFLIANSFDDGATLLVDGTPQHSAYQWLSQNKNITEYSDEVKLARYALATFYYSTNGPTTWDEEIRNGSWMTDAPECQWATTSSNQCTDGNYTSLTLDYVGVSGQIPEELALLSGLTRLSLRSEGAAASSVSGSLPESIGRLGNLETIRLNENNIGGVLPTSIGGLSNVRVFLLSGNSIRGSIPSEIGLTGGNTFNFDRNKLSGKLPNELFAMGTLTAVNFEENTLTGTIPTQIGLNPALNFVNFASNTLSGTIPSEIGKLVTAKAGINLSSNELSGTLPSEIGFLAGMRLLRLDGNALSGSLPQAVCDSFTARTEASVPAIRRTRHCAKNKQKALIVVDREYTCRKRKSAPRINEMQAVFPEVEADGTLLRIEDVTSELSSSGQPRLHPCWDFTAR